MNPFIKTPVRKVRAFCDRGLFLFVGLFTGLIGDTTRGFARGLAGSLAFAAAAIFYALGKVASLKGLNVFHIKNSLSFIFSLIIRQGKALVKPE